MLKTSKRGEEGKILGISWEIGSQLVELYCDAYTRDLLGRRCIDVVELLYLYRMFFVRFYSQPFDLY